MALRVIQEDSAAQPAEIKSTRKRQNVTKSSTAEKEAASPPKKRARITKPKAVKAQKPSRGAIKSKKRSGLTQVVGVDYSTLLPLKYGVATGEASLGSSQDHEPSSSDLEDTRGPHATPRELPPISLTSFEGSGLPTLPEAHTRTQLWCRSQAGSQSYSDFMYAHGAAGLGSPQMSLRTREKSGQSSASPEAPDSSCVVGNRPGAEYGIHYQHATQLGPLDLGETSPSKASVGKQDSLFSMYIDLEACSNNQDPETEGGSCNFNYRPLKESQPYETNGVIGLLTPSLASELSLPESEILSPSFQPFEVVHLDFEASSAAWDGTVPSKEGLGNTTSAIALGQKEPLKRCFGLSSTSSEVIYDSRMYYSNSLGLFAPQAPTTSLSTNVTPRSGETPAPLSPSISSKDDADDVQSEIQLGQTTARPSPLYIAQHDPSAEAPNPPAHRQGTPNRGKGPIIRLRISPKSGQPHTESNLSLKAGPGATIKKRGRSDGLSQSRGD